MMATETATELRWRAIETPVGVLVVASEESGGITTQWADDNWNRDDMSGGEDRRMLPELVSRILRYFQGESVNFDDIPTPLGPDFHSRCWAACRGIPVGTTISYAELARRADSTHHASRAAGQAMRRNRLPVIIPCHRVIASSGKLGGYAGSDDADSKSLARKRYLLDLERNQADS